MNIYTRGYWEYSTSILHTVFTDHRPVDVEFDTGGGGGGRDPFEVMMKYEMLPSIFAFYFFTQLIRTRS